LQVEVRLAAPPGEAKSELIYGSARRTSSCTCAEAGFIAEAGFTTVDNSRRWTKAATKDFVRKAATTLQGLADARSPGAGNASLMMAAVGPAPVSLNRSPSCSRFDSIESRVTGWL
jgi:hypothetical protein